MTKKEARARQAELKYRIESHLDVIKRLNDEMSGLEAIISKKDDWRDREISKDEYVLLANKITLMQEMHQFAHVRNEGWMPVWKSSSQPKWGLIYGSFNHLYLDNKYTSNNFIFGVAVKSREIAQEMLEEFGERIGEIYNIQY